MITVFGISMSIPMVSIGMLVLLAIVITILLSVTKANASLVLFTVCLYIAFAIGMGVKNGTNRVFDHPYTYPIETGVKYHLLAAHKDGSSLVLNIVSISKNKKGFHEFRTIRVKGPKPPINFILGKSGVPIAITP